MPSLASKAMPALLALRGSKKTFSSAEATRKQVAALALRPDRYGPPKSLDRKVDLAVRRVCGWPVYDVIPKDVEPTRRALYTHGGAWIHEITPSHWRFIAELVAATQTVFTVPIYPLAPVGTAATVIPVITDLAAELLAAVGPERCVLIGDSAGGGMALAIAMQLRDRGLPAPRATVLISPSLDLSFSNPQIAKIAPRDPFLGVPGLHVAARLWRGELPIDDPMVSPIYGDLTGLAPITMFSGTDDILNADATTLVELARGTNLDVELHEAPGMIHVYPLLPIPEAKQARSTIKELLRR